MINLNQKLKTILCVLLFLPACILLYTLAHESGHALVLLAYGGVIDNFSLGLNAHVSAHGVNFTPFGEALNCVAGMLFPTILGAIALCFYQPNVQFAGYHIGYLCASISLVSSTITWIILPIISLFAPLPLGDDVTEFLDVVGINPLFVSLGACLLIAAFVFLLMKKGLLKRAIEMFHALRKNKVDRKHILLIVGTVVFSVVVTIAILGGVAFSPAVFETSIVTDNVLETTYRECTFIIEESKSYSVDLAIRSPGLITAVRIVDENGQLVYQDLAEDFATEFTMELQKGIHTLSLSYLADYEAVEHFFESTAQGDVLLEWSDYYKEVLEHDTDNSASFSIKIQ
jgi:hypothetical protein